MFSFLPRRSSIPLRSGDVRSLRAQSIVLSLLLAASGALAWEAVAEHRSLVANTSRTAQQTASAAAGSLVRLAYASQLGTLLRAFTPITDRAEDDTPAARARFAKIATHPATAEWCSMYDVPCQRGPALYVFHIDLRTRAWSATAPVAPAVQRWIRDSVTYEATHEYQTGWQLAALDAEIAGVPHVVSYRVAFDGAGTPVAANGLEVDIVPAARQAFARVFASSPLLTIPAAEGVPNDSLFMVRVVGSGATELFRSGGRAAPASAATVPGQPTWEFGRYDVHLALTPRLRAALDAGAEPRQMVVSTSVLFLFCVVLVGIAILQGRREAALARLRETFIGNVSHELRTPLAQIRLHAEALQYGYIRGDSARDNALGVITSESVRLKHLVDNVLTYSRDGSGQLALTLVPVDVAAVLDDVVRRLEPIAARAGMALDVRVDCAPLAVADRTALEQIVANLVDNAVRYAAGTESVVLRAERRGNVVRVAVEDTGPGIPPQDRARVFDRFVRLDNAASVAGTGIGLSIVATLVHAMHGRVQIADVVPHGTEFQIELPAA